MKAEDKINMIKGAIKLLSQSDKNNLYCSDYEKFYNTVNQILNEEPKTTLLCEDWDIEK